LRKELFFPSIEGEARILILINQFSGKTKCLEGRTKLAKLDFFLRYPGYLKRALKVRSSEKKISDSDLIIPDSIEDKNIEHRMVRFRYGPWDPAYYGILGRLIGKDLIEPTSISRGIGFRTTEKGQMVANSLSKEIDWKEISNRSKLLRKHFDLSGSFLKDFVYKHFPEVTQAKWGEEL
jgi:hypothetical protein